MKMGVAVVTFMLTGCGTLPLVQVQGPQVTDSDCTASCSAHFEQCPQIFANFPERGAVECPAEHDRCLKACASSAKSVRTPVAAPPRASAAAAGNAAPASAGPPSAAPAGAVGASAAGASAAKEAKLRELKRFYDEGLVSEDVYRARQTAILAEP
jgi:hypothetical protein